MKTKFECLSAQLVKVIKNFNSKKSKLSYNDVDYFSILNEEDENAKFSCQIIDIQEAINIIELTTKKLDLPEFDKAGFLVKICYQTFSDEVYMENKLFLNYY